MSRTGLIVFLLVISFFRLPAQSLPNSCLKSTEGREFWFGFMENRYYQVPQAPYYLSVVHYLEITLVSVHTCNVQIFIGKSSTPDILTVTPGNPVQFRIPWQQVEAMGSETPQDKAIHVISDNPLNLYALNWCENSADVAVIYPVESLGTSYFTMCYTPNIDSYLDEFGIEYYRSGRNSEFLIVATEDLTKVQITPSKVTDKLRPANIPFEITLNKGEVYQVQSLNHEGLAGQGDLTGSYILSDKPVALFSGSLATTVPALEDVSAWDHLYEQMPPVNTWGRKFVTVPLKGRTEDYYRILASADNTRVSIGETIQKVLNKGEFFEFVLSADEPKLIECDHPVLLAQYMISNSVDRPPGYNMYTWDGDPFMVVVSPVSQTAESVTFVAYDSNNIKNKYYVNVVAKDEVAGSILLDGLAISFQGLPNSGYSYAQVQIARGSHTLQSTAPGGGFTAFVYGYGGVESYGYGVGFNLNLTLDLGGTVDASGDKVLVNCQGSGPLTLNAGDGFSSYAWNTGENSPAIQVIKPGTYSVRVTTDEGCVLLDSVRVILSAPSIDLGVDRILCPGDSAVLDAGATDHFATVTWSTPAGTATGSKVTASLPGTYSVLGTNSHGCMARDTVNVNFDLLHAIDLGPDRFVCFSDTIELDAGSSGEFASYLWTTPWGTLATRKIMVSKPGTYSVLAATAAGCAAGDTVTIGFSAKPVLDISRIDTLICGSFSTTLDVTADRPVEFLVTSSPEVSVNGLNLSVSPQNAGTYRVTITAKDESSCETTETVTIGFYPTPTAGFTLSSDQCLETGENQISYLGTGTVQDTYQWNLSDFSTGEIVRDPGNTQGPFVFLLEDKPQASIGLQVVSQFGCKSEEAAVTVKRKPVFSIQSEPVEGCVPLEVNFTAETGDPVDQVDYFWNFGDGNEVTGTDLTQTYATPGNFPVYLRAVSTLTGCQDEENLQDAITVHPKPVAGFSVKPEMVYNDQPEASFQDESSGATRYAWDFGDGTTSVSQSPVHRFQSAGIKKVIQTVFNEFNCSDSVSREVTVAVSKIFTPNAFSPNAANAIDREFRLFMNGVVESGYHLRILSRWNDVLFDCRDVIKGWNGQLSDGSMAPPGSYVWILEFRDFMGKFHRQTGTVVLFY